MFFLKKSFFSCVFKLLLVLASCQVCASSGNLSEEGGNDSRKELLRRADEKALELYQKINKNWVYPKDNETKLSSPENWDLEKVETLTGTTYSIIWDPRKAPDLETAINELVDSKLVMECANAARIVRLGILRELLGNDKIMALPNEISRKLASEKNFTFYNLIQELSWKFYEKADSLNEDEFYAFPFVNHESYALFKPNGDESNHNVVRLLNGNYVGFAPDFFESSKTHDEMEWHLFNVLRDDSFLDQENKGKHGQMCDKLTFDTFKVGRSELQKLHGYFRLDLEAILAYINS